LVSIVARVEGDKFALEMSSVFLELFRRPGAIEVVPRTVLTSTRSLIALLAAFATWYLLAEVVE
jgi:hypothetical protein